MDKNLLGAIVVASSVVFSSAAIADPDYGTDQIVEFLIKSADMGAARGVCIGTIAECVEKISKLTSFDMLVNFEIDSAELTESARANLAQIAKALLDRRLSAAKFIVEGHTDASGSEDYNLDLSERRANSVADFLRKQGIARDKVKAIGIGESSPRTENRYDPANRRVEIRISLQ